MSGADTPSQSLLSADGVMRKLDISRSTLDRWLRDGTLPAPIRAGRLRRWRVEAIEKWLDEQERAAA